MDIIIRQAVKSDATFVARGVCMALHHDAEGTELEHIAKICERKDVLYSYRHAMVAEVDGQTAGICLCYDGALYHELRAITFPLFGSSNEEMDLEHAEDEAKEGEWYVDSLAVLPEYRRLGIGRKLLEAQLAKAHGLRPTLLVDPNNPPAQRLYKSLGFKHLRDCYAFGQTFWKWVIE